MLCSTCKRPCLRACECLYTLRYPQVSDDLPQSIMALPQFRGVQRHLVYAPMSYNDCFHFGPGPLRVLKDAKTQTLCL